MEPSTLMTTTEAVSADYPEVVSLVCPYCGSPLSELGGLLRCALCQFSFCRACGDERPE